MEGNAYSGLGDAMVLGFKALVVITIIAVIVIGVLVCNSIRLSKKLQKLENSKPTTQHTRSFVPKNTMIYYT